LLVLLRAARGFLVFECSVYSLHFSMAYRQYAQLIVFFYVFGIVHSSAICDYGSNTFALETDLVKISFFESPPSFQIKYSQANTADGKKWQLTFSVTHLLEVAIDNSITADYDITNLPSENFEFECERYPKSHPT
jgi:hypothetical protein